MSHKKLKDFFAFTKELGIKTVTPDIWKELFNKGEIVTKDAEGKEVKYSFEKPIDAKDLEKDFDGLYRKLNGLAVTKKNQEYIATREQEKKRKSAEEEVKSPQASQTVKAPESTKVGDDKTVIPAVATASTASQGPTVARAMTESQSSKPKEAAAVKPQATQESVLTEALLSETSFPFSFTHDNKKETVSFTDNQLQIGDKKFSLAVK